MRSTFMGLETAKRGMYAQQSAIYVTGNNIANKNTPGYTRQRVNFVQTEPYPAASMNRPQIPGQLGTGVTDGSIQRIRESFIDEQYRNENNKFGYYNDLANSISKMEDIMNEPSDTGLSKAMAQFWQSLQDLSKDADNEGVRRVVLQRGMAVAETFKYLHSSLTTVRGDIKKELDASVTEINSLAKQIASINKQISDVEPHGYLPNDLYDERDRLLDQLSNIVPIETSTVSYGGNSLAFAEGGRNVEIVLGGERIMLVDDRTGNELELNGDQLGIKGSTDSITFGESAEGKGKIAALIQAYGEDGPPAKGLYPEMLEDLDKYAFTFAKVFNAVHQEGFDINGKKGEAFFSVDNDGSYQGAASSISVSLKNPSDIAASLKPTHQGNGDNALNFGKIKDLVITEGTITLPSGKELKGLDIESGTLQSFYEGVIGKMAVEGQQANRLYYNTGVLLNSVDNNRRSVSEVSLDEEFSNLIQYQHAYSASARMITVVDEMLDKIINGMGTAGR
ncbi:flagellar hook-associated protein FlgK [Bacillus sp. FSL K6-3431]|uniref:flagellar hook-associated protein FlgK n=1 Tax=Bacillus sp. FSL K6-3431 TaxID=2921500 RepID=UPI0030F9943A